MRTQSHQSACDTENPSAYALDAYKEFSFTKPFHLLPNSSEILAKNVLLLLLTCCYYEVLEERLHKQVSWVAVVHADHAPHRHVHVLAVVVGRLQVQDFESLRQAATAASVTQRRQADQVLKAKEQEREEAQWEPQH